MQVLSVSGLNQQVKHLLETTFLSVKVEGEVSRPTYHSSGHVYFSLKDANSVIKCVMFRGNASRLRFRLEDGLKIILDGAITVYSPRGEYQINVVSAQPAGQGSLSLAYEQLKKSLAAKGYFEPSHKKPLIKFPSKICIITSATGAALQDMLRVVQNRFPLVKIRVIDVLVQGEMAAKQIAQAIKQADKMQDIDTIVIGRGGGSMEDLWAFNEEVVAHAIFHANTPLVSAVGHEIDYALSDFVADLRAPTPSAAMEMILPDIKELMMSVDTLVNNYEGLFRRILHQKHEALSHLQRSFSKYSIENKLKNYEEELEALQAQLDTRLNFLLQRKSNELTPLAAEFERAMSQLFTQKQAQYKRLQEAFSLHDPAKNSKNGFVQLTQKGEVKTLEELSLESEVELSSASMQILAKVIEKKSF